ncbi:HDOD domain-containing protein [Anaerotignum sp.]|uniref:HDOD domain-containing protein n=1 Tax=Anaerotignum sp. TaxID=2039241 RepID=UPI002714985C|nr:HDOD domain-containing protein [Anaerotignum sp.]
MKKILLVDDEIPILKALERAFFDTDYDIYTAQSGEQALGILENTEVNLVISDMKMPFMDGYELLSKIKEKYPQTIRIILSGYTEEKTIIKAIIKNIAKVYFFKPWNNEELIHCVEQLFYVESILNANNLLVLINNLDSIPTISLNYRNILSLLETDEDIKTISYEIEKDLAISTNLLHVANSALYGVKIGSVKQAVTYLGLQNTKLLITSTSILSSINSNGYKNRDFEKLWDHSRLANKILTIIYEKFLNKKLPETCFSAGLLHNIGILAMNYELNSKFIGTDENFNNLLDLENNEYGFTHQEVGGYLLSWWELPFPIVEAALFHHHPFNDAIVNKELVFCVHIAQKYAWEIMNEPMRTPFYPKTFTVLEIEQYCFEQRLKEFLEQ